MAVGVLSGCLGLSDTTKTMYGLDESGRRTRCKGGSKIVKQGLAACKVEVLAMRDVPDCCPWTVARRWGGSRLRRAV